LGKNGKGFEIFNVANERESTIGEVADLIKELTNSKSEIKFIDAPKKRYDYEVGRRFGSSAKLENHIGYKPNTRLREGLQVLLADIKN